MAVVDTADVDDEEVGRPGDETVATILLLTEPKIVATDMLYHMTWHQAYIHTHVFKIT